MTTILPITTNPQTWADGVWPRAQMNGHAGNGKWQFSFTFTSSSQGSDWGAFFGRPTGGMWRTTSGTIDLYDVDDNMLLSIPATNTNGQTGTFTIDAANGFMTIAGMATGNGTHAYTAADIFTAGVLKAGGIDGQTGWTIAGTFSDVTDGDTSVSRTAATTAAAGASVAAARDVVRGVAATSAAGAVVGAARRIYRGSAATSVVGASVNADTAAGGTSRTAAVSAAAGAVVVANRDVPRSAAGASSAGATSAANREAIRGAAASSVVGAVVAASSGVQFVLGVSSSSIDTFGRTSAGTGLNAPGGFLPSGGADADGRVPAAVNSQATGSTFYAFTGRPTSPSTALTDNKGNTYTLVQSRTYDPPFDQWALQTYVKVLGAGGANHVVNVAVPDGNEATLGWTEIQKCSNLHSSSIIHRALGDDQSSLPVYLDAPGWVIVDWSGESATFGAEGFVWTVEANGEGPGPNQWQVIDSRIVNHNDGWIQWKRWARYFPGPTSGIQLSMNTATMVPNQGANFMAAAFQEIQQVLRSASTTAAAGAVTAASREVLRGAAGTSTAAAAVAAAREVVRQAGAQSTPGANTAATRTAAAVSRTAAVTAAVDAIVAAVSDRTRAAALVGVVGAVVAAIRDDVRGAAITAVASAIAAANRDVARTAIGSSVVGAAASAIAVPAGSTVRGAVTVSATGAIAAATRQVIRGSAIAAIAGAAAAASGGRGYTAAIFAIAGASVSATLSEGSLPPLPLEVVIPFPPRRQREGRQPNPRIETPNRDPGLRVNPRPECSLVESLADLVDEMRQLETEIGLRYYQVFSVLVRWSGGERHRGTPTVISETPFLPTPEVTGIATVARELRSGGAVKRGQIWLRGISPRYTQDDIVLLCSRDLKPDEEAFIEVRGDGRDGSTIRDRYVVSGHPERNAFGWDVQLTKQDENRSRRGIPQ